MKKMTNLQHERRKLLNEKNISISNTRFSEIRNVEEESTSSSSMENNNEDDTFINGTNRVNRNRTPISLPKKSRRRKNILQRSARRILRLMICMLLVPIVFLTLYLPLYTDVQGRRVALLDWGYNTSRNIADYVLPENETTIIEPRHACRNKNFLLIVVCSSALNFAARQAIRETWANVTEFNYGMFSQLHAHLKDQYLNPPKRRLKYYSEFLHFSKNQKTLANVLPVEIVFLIGRSKDESVLGNETIARLSREREQYDDIIQENFIDTYNNLTLKSVLALKWAKRHCLQQSAYFMKCDDDTFVNIPNLLHFLLGGTVPLYNDTFEFYDLRSYQTLSPSNRLNDTHDYLAGHMFCTSRPIANVSSKWYMPYYMFPADIYPKYLSGSAYLMSMDVVPRLYEMALNTTFIYLEDVYLTGMCAENAQIERRHNPLFSYTRSKKWCSFKGLITQHEMKDESMLEAYNFVANVSNRCPPPGKYFKRIRLRKTADCM